MKITKDLEQLTVTQSEFAKAVGVSLSQIQQMIERGIIVQSKDSTRENVLLLQSIKNYEENQAGQDENNEVNYIYEKALHEAADRKIAELKLQRIEQSVYDAATVEFVHTEMLSYIRKELLAFIPKLALELQNKSRSEIYEIMTQAIYNKLTEIAAYVPDEYKDLDISTD